MRLSPALLLVPTLLLSTLLLAEPATAPAMRRYDDPTAAQRWSIEIPDDWTANDRYASRGILQFSHRGAMTLTVSSVTGLLLPDQPEISMLDMAFPDAEPMSDPQPMRGDGWIGLFRTYQDRQSPRNHVGLVAMRDDALVLVTISSPQSMTAEQMDQIASILARLRVGDAAAPASRPAE